MFLLWLKPPPERTPHNNLKYFLFYFIISQRGSIRLLGITFCFFIPDLVKQLTDAV